MGRKGNGGFPILYGKAPIAFVACIEAFGALLLFGSFSENDCFALPFRSFTKLDFAPGSNHSLCCAQRS